MRISVAPRARRAWLLAALVLAAATVGMLVVRSSLDKAHVALVYLLVGPGAFSVDAYLFGRERAQTRERGYERRRGLA